MYSRLLLRLRKHRRFPKGKYQNSRSSAGLLSRFHDRLKSCLRRLQWTWTSRCDLGNVYSLMRAGGLLMLMKFCKTRNLLRDPKWTFTSGLNQMESCGSMA